MLYNSFEADGNRAHVTHRKRERGHVVKISQNNNTTTFGETKLFLLRFAFACRMCFWFLRFLHFPLFLCCKRSCCTTGGISFSNCSVAPVPKELSSFRDILVWNTVKEQEKHCSASLFRFGRAKTNWKMNAKQEMSVTLCHTGWVFQWDSHRK